MPWSAYWRLARLDRPAGIYLLLWPTLTALWLAAQGQPSLKMVVIFTVGAWIMRAAGGIINDYIDRDLDGHVERTRTRPLASGELSAKQGLQCFAFLITCALVLVLQLNLFTLQLAICAAILTCLYPFMKRIMSFPQAVLGIVWSFSILMAYTAQDQAFTATTGWLFAGNFLLTLAYDTIYGMSDRKDDLKVGIKSLAITLGHQDRLIIGVFQILCLGCWFQVGQVEHLGSFYTWGLLGCAVFMLFTQSLIATRDPALCLRAFTLHSKLVAYLFGLILISQMIH